jgi:hypothetical protein
MPAFVHLASTVVSCSLLSSSQFHLAVTCFVVSTQIRPTVELQGALAASEARAAMARHFYWDIGAPAAASGRPAVRVLEVTPDMAMQQQ